MKIKHSFYILILLSQFAFGQNETYTIEKASFSSDLFDEFSPVYYNHGIVFCSSRHQGFANYSDDNNKSPFKISYIDTTGRMKWKAAELLSRDLTTRLNDGPSTFSKYGDTIYFSRNLIVDPRESKLLGIRNKLGIFSAAMVDEKWINIKEFRFNNEWYNVTMPYLTPDGQRLYFASDKPGGYGGLDLYYSVWRKDYWDAPVNMGHVINTPGNEGYPFINPAGELFFSSDGHPGFGGKDIFFSRQKDGNWLLPVRLDPPINSKDDDFGFISDSLIEQGYFSTNRNNSIDIFKFRTNIPQIFYTDKQRENKYCFSLSDSGDIELDTSILEYVWSFGDGKKASGGGVNHCFPGPGTYEVKLDLIDRATGNLFFTKLSYTLELKDFEQAFIDSPATLVSGEQTVFTSIKSFLPGYEVLSCSWDFGDGTRMEGENVTHAFRLSGEYDVNLGVKLRSLTTGIVHNTGISKKLTVFNNSQDRESYIKKNTSGKVPSTDIREYENAHITIRFSAEEEFRQEALFRIEIQISKKRINNSVFKNLAGKYAIKEVNDSVSGNYSYIADEQMSLMSVYPAFRELLAFGFRESRIRLDAIKDPVEKELVILKKRFGILTDTYFDSGNKLTGKAYILLDQVVILMNRNPGIRLEIGVHTDNMGAPANNLLLSRNRSQMIVNYLISRGISSKDLVAIGYGSTRPVASNSNPNDRRLNRRVDFKIIGDI